MNLTFFYIHINAFSRKAINKAKTWPSHAHIYSNQRKSSVFVNWTKEVCPKTRHKWWQLWGTPDIIWNRVRDRRRSKRKRAITKCCHTECWSIGKRHGVWAGESAAGVWWLFLQHVSDIWWCSTAVAVVAQTSYFVGAPYIDRKKWCDFKCVVMFDDFGMRKIIRAALVCIRCNMDVTS